MAFMLIQWIINDKYAHWIVILQEFNLKFVTPKIKKGLAFAELIYEFCTGAPHLPVNDDLLGDHLFTITIEDSWYGDILTYL